MLNSLSIKNFRSLEDFEVKKLGRVNLIVGKNNSGKSTVLEALRLYAGNAQRPLLDAIAAEHDEKTTSVDSEPDAPQPFQDLFTGRRFPENDDVSILIGETDVAADRLSIYHVHLTEIEEAVTDESTGETSTRIRRRHIPKADLANFDGDVISALMISKGERVFSPIFLDPSSRPPRASLFDAGGTIPCSAVPTQFISIDELADGWDKVVFTEHEDVIRQALRIITPEFENLTFVRNEDYRARNSLRNSFQRSARVKLAGVPRPVPLNSLGDGMLRVLQLALKIFPAKGGFLLIDEFENGLHYGIQEKVWALLFEMAEKLGFQVFATTHSWDCIESFTKAAINRQDIDGVLFRVGRSVRESDKGRVIATVFDEEALYNITQAEVEVR
jgi:AAA15 family ATPase/GTPase